MFHCVVKTHPRYLRIARAVIAVAALTCFGIITVNLDLRAAKSSIRDKDVDAANKNANLMLGNVSFLDPRLQLRSYTIVPNPNKCAHAKFVLIVHIKVDDQSGRKRWRETYGNPLLMQKFMYSLIFSVGLPYSTEQQDRLNNESRVYGDILQASYVDSYRNLTLKQLAELRYVASSCQNIKAVIKLDDDVGWNVEKATQFINNDLKENEICCSRRSNFSPAYNPGQKWTVTKEEWSLATYPTHCVGMMYITSMATIKRMLAVVHLQKFFWIDDVFITGVLTEASNVTVRHIDDINEEWKFPLDVSDGVSFFNVHNKYFVYWFLVYNQNVI